jgi:hypothetical protein
MFCLCEGAGMLTGGVAGSVFASPPTSSILEAIRALATDNPGKSADQDEKQQIFYISSYREDQHCFFNKYDFLKVLM